MSTAGQVQGGPAADVDLDVAADVAGFTHVTVVGAGLVGGSFAAASMQVEGVEVVTLVDRDPDALAVARGRAIGHRWSTDLAVAASSDLVVLAVPVPAMGTVAEALRPHLRDDALVTDVGSVKGEVDRVLTGLLGDRYLGGHPMAGSEESGMAAATATLFQGATWLLTPSGTAADGGTAGFERLAAHLRAIGARVLAVPPDLHDDLVAIASHLPQALASVLMSVADDAAARSGPGQMAVTAGGFRDVTRVAASDPDLWVGILRENREAFLHAVDAFQARLGDLREAVAGGAWGLVRDELARAREARRSLPRKQVGDVLVDLVVPIPDRPGALAEVTTALGTAGINIEDLSMRHGPLGARGAMVIAVDGHAVAAQATAVLAERGYEAHAEVRG